MKRYYKHAAESDIGEGIAYIEITGEWVSRQVEIYGERYRWADENNSEWLADQPLGELGFDFEDEITSEEFEKIWKEVKEKCQ